MVLRLTGRKVDADRRPAGHRLFVALFALIGPFLVACESNPPNCDPSEGQPPLFAAGGQSCEPPPPCDDCAGGWGDPHMTSFDGLRYDLMAVGEFTLATNGDTEVQIRTAPVGNSTSVSQITGMAVVHGRTTASVTRSADEGWDIRVNDSVLDVADVYTEANVVVFRDEVDKQLIVTFPGDVHVFVDLRSNALDVHLQMPGEVSGLLGDRNGDPDDDFRTRDGQALASDIAAEEFYGTFAESWRITDADSGFTYGAGENTETYTDREFPTSPPSLDDLDDDVRKRAEEVCRAAGVVEPFLDDCILDVGVTGDDDLALSALRAQGRWNAAHGTSAKISGDGTAQWMLELNVGGFRDPRAQLVNGLLVVTNADFAVGIDPTDGSEVWRLEGIRPCGASVAGADRIALIADRDGPLGVDGKDALLLVSVDDGDVLSSAGLAQNAVYCGELHTLGDIVILTDSIGHGATAWNVNGDMPEPVWQVPGSFAHNTRVGDRVAALRKTDQGWEVVLLDAQGEVATHPLPAGYDSGNLQVPATIAGDGDLLAVALTRTGGGDDALPDGLLGLRASEDGLAEVWQRTVPIDIPGSDPIDGRIANLAAKDGLLVGQNSDGLLVGFDLATGDVRWVQPGLRYDWRSPALITQKAVYQGVASPTVFATASSLVDGTVEHEWLGTELFGAVANVTAVGPLIEESVIVLFEANFDTNRRFYVAAIPSRP